MGFREDLPLSFIKDYEWALQTGAPQDLVEGEEQSQPLANPGAPFVVGNGPIHCSTSTSLIRAYPPSHVWDANGWYRSLGANHRMTKAELRRAYVASDGPNDPRKTFAFKSLLNARVRRSYDLLPLGQMYMDDPWVQDWIKARITDLAAQMTAAGNFITPEALLSEMGMKLEDDQDRRAEMLDEDDHGTDNEYSAPTEWVYAWYAWKVDPEVWDHLAEPWQKALIRECSKRGIVTRLRIGLMSGPDQFRTILIDGEPVVFANIDTRHSTLIATFAVDELTQYIN
jgi:hypothetical protein